MNLKTPKVLIAADRLNSWKLLETAAADVVVEELKSLISAA